MKFDFLKRKKGSDLEKIISESLPEIEEDERQMILAVLGLGETQVKMIMVPRTDVVAASSKMPFDDLVSFVIKSGHSRIPVYEDTIDNVVGFLYAKDLIPHLVKKAERVDVRKILRPVLFVPEGKRIDELLKVLKQKKMHIAIVVDEYGGMAGIVSLEDVLEQIVGDIQDEYDEMKYEGKKEIKKASRGARLRDGCLCDARTSLDELNEEMGLHLPTDRSDTLGGFVFNLFGSVPKASDVVSYGNIEFKIEKMDGRRIKKVRLKVKRQKKSPENGSR